ncbi:MAG: stage V sporulation protein AE [Clostridiales bacterium]|nr:stage V sporulation protein AE [Clostridiales bacterium]
MSPVILSFIKAFLVGGAICVVGQILLDKTRLTAGRILVGFVVAGVILGAFGIYSHIAQFAGAGASIPLTGFGYTLAKGVKTAVDSEGFVGIFSGAIRASASGITAAVVFGLLFAIISKPKMKK